MENVARKAGFKGKKNVYICKACGHGFVTLDVDNGVTPMFTSCIYCAGTAGSMMYNIPQGLLGEPAVRWIKPSAVDARKLAKPTQDHVKRGGLIRDDMKPTKKAGNHFRP